jgi:hypothetical protein
MRRNTVLLLSVVVLLGTLLIGGGRFVAAQDASPADTMTHPIVGSWMLDLEPEVPDDPFSLVRFSADGGYLQIDPDGTNSIGAWEPTGDNSAILTLTFVTEEDGTSTARATVDVDPDGETFTATYTLEFVDLSGESSGEIGPGTAEGTRMVVEGPGEPVASFEEAFGEFEATPEATPAS